MDLFSNRIMTNKMKLKIKISNLKNSNSNNKEFPNLRPSSSKNLKKKKSYSFNKPYIEKFEKRLNENKIKIDYERENKELKLKLEILQKEMNKIQNENNELKKKLEDEYIPRNKKKIILMNNQRIKFNSFNDYSMNTTTTKVETKINSEQSRKTEIKNSFDKKIPIFNTIEPKFNHDIKFKLVKSRQILSLNKNTKSYCNINNFDFEKNKEKDCIYKMELIRKRTLKLFENYNILLQGHK